MKIQDLLRQKKVPFEILKHTRVTQLREAAKESKVPAGELAQAMLVRANHGYRYVIAVVPPGGRIDLHLATQALQGCDLQPASDDERAKFCPDCEAGLMPFGSHYNVSTLLDESLSRRGAVVFDEIGGSEAIRTKVSDYCELEHPLVVPLTAPS